MRIVKGPCLIDIGPNPFLSASRRRAHIKTQRIEIPEKVYGLLRKRDGKNCIYCIAFQAKFHSMLHHPETLSRVILALLGSVFHTNSSDTRLD